MNFKKEKYLINFLTNGPGISNFYSAENLVLRLKYSQSIQFAAPSTLLTEAAATLAPHHPFLSLRRPRKKRQYFLPKRETARRHNIQDRNVNTQ